MSTVNRQTCFQIETEDNVCTALADLVPGLITIHGNSGLAEIEAVDSVNSGHKLANRDIQKDEFIIKYGVAIGKAICPIQKGEWVHLHNCRSLYDERSGTLDVKTGAPTDTHYE